MSDLLNLYHQLPYPLRGLAASARGFYLLSWRYGHETERLAQEAISRERWTKQQWETWQEERLAFILQRAASQVPYYQEYWRQRRNHGDRASWERLENWPLLTKETLRQNPYAFVAQDCNIRKMYSEHTSGTTGKPLSLWLSRKTMRNWYALFEARVRRWHGLTRYNRWAILGGQLVSPFGQTRPPFWVWNAALNQLYMSSYHLAPKFIAAYLEAIQRYRVVYLYGYASSLYALAKIALEKDLKRPNVSLAISNAEPLYRHQRETIAEAFQCQVRDTYGMSELVCAASECEEGYLHLWPEVGVLEVFQDDSDQFEALGEAGRLICTGLLNEDMPLIRYEVGDRGSVAPPFVDCSCGRTLAVLQSVEGRQDDVILTRDGRRVGRLDPIFKADLPIREAQIIQESLDRIRILIVPDPDYRQSDGDSIIDRLRQRIGAEDVTLEQVEKIPRTANGKFRAVVSRITTHVMIDEVD